MAAATSFYHMCYCAVKFSDGILLRREFRPSSYCAVRFSFGRLTSVYFTRSRSWSYVERPGLLLLGALLIAQLTNPFDLFETFLG
ncbi:plasma membrane ATPase isoform X6 [Arachis hypogaea]|uniref:plasma membrane ATPase isoform X6 n=1 Tax=Arachis hypogaea TaxID=3818 RepID=UPI003B21ED25